MYCVVFFRQMVVVWWVWVYEPLYKDVAVEWPLVLVIITILSITLSFIFGWTIILDLTNLILFHLFIPHFDHRILSVCPRGNQIYLNKKKYTSFIKSFSIFTARFFRFMDEILHRYLYSQFIGIKLADVTTDRNNWLEKLSLVICDMSVIILQMDLQTDKTRQKKTLFNLLCRYFHNWI
jgi:hypothetical protein